MMSLQQVTVQTTPRPGAPVNPDELAQRIEAAVEKAIEGAVEAGETRGIGDRVRSAVDEVRAEIAAARELRQGYTIQPFPQDVIPPQVVDVSIALFAMIAFIVVGLPLARAFARRMDRRGETASASEVAPRLDRIEQAIEAVAIEVERVSEGQRYTTKAISDLRGLPDPSPAGWPAGAAERVPAAEARRP